MKKFIIGIIYLFCTPYLSFSQSFGISTACNVNVNTAPVNRNNIKRATFKIFLKRTANSGSLCTGTLINRQIDQNSLGNYFLISRHCLNNLWGTDPININLEHDFMFNYQAPNPNNNLSTPLSNRGTGFFQSIANSDNGYQYLHSSRIRIVSIHYPQDMALCEILKPIPPHFNVAYAGWYPGMGSFIPIPGGSDFYFNASHPRGDIKKMASTWFAVSSPISAPCRILAKTVDFLFGWIWGNSYSQESACSNTELPWAYVPLWDVGRTEDGSSGSGLFNGNNSYLGALSWGLDGCAISGNSAFSKLRVIYYDQPVKNTLNPNNKFWTDQNGMDDRRILCYQNLNNLSGEYFAASAYQSDNKIILQSATTVTTNGTLRIHPGSDYSLLSSQSITLGPGFQVVTPQPGETGGIFEARTASCVVPRSDEKSNDIPSDVMRKARNLELPQYKPFNPQQFLNKDNGLLDLDAQSEIQAYPNPSSDGNFTVRFVVDAKKSVNLAFTDLLGKTIYTTQYSCIQGENYFPLDMSGKGIAEGMYFITVDDGVNKKVKKVVIK